MQLAGSVGYSAREINQLKKIVEVRLLDGREIGVPLEWFPRLRDASDDQRKRWRLIGKGIGITWEELDEDISVSGLMKA